MPSVSYLLGEDSECSPCGSVRHGVPNDDFHFIRKVIVVGEN